MSSRTRAGASGGSSTCSSTLGPRAKARPMRPLDLCRRRPKQSIYRFRHAESPCSTRLPGDWLLRPGAHLRHAITTSFRAVPELCVRQLSLCGLGGNPDLADRGATTTPTVPVPEVGLGARRDGQPCWDSFAEPTLAASAAAVAEELARLLEQTVVRDRAGSPRANPAGRHRHPVRVRAPDTRCSRTPLKAVVCARTSTRGWVFFDAPEVQMCRRSSEYLARRTPTCEPPNVLRSRLVRVVGRGLLRWRRLASPFSRHRSTHSSAGLNELDAALLAEACRACRGGSIWPIDPPSEVLDIALRESAYVFRVRGGDATRRART